MLKAAIYNDAKRPAYDFKFKREVSTVFDDMAVRSHLTILKTEACNSSLR